MTKYMLIETSLLSRKDDVYERFIRCGRMLPDGLIYIYSWLEKKRRKVLSVHGDRRLQLVRGMDRALE